MTEPQPRPQIAEAFKAVDADDDAFRLLQRSGVMALIFNRRRRAGGIPSRNDVRDYEAMLAVLEAPPAA